MASDSNIKEVPVANENTVVMPVQYYWQKYGKPAAILIGVLLIAFLAWVAYNAWIVQPKEEQAQRAIYKAEQYFAQDSSQLVLTGDGVNKGVLYIINNYDGTKTANLAKFYAGVSYLKTGRYADAVKYLKDFSTDSKPVQLKAYGCLGDAYSELNNKTEAIDAYKKAATTFEFDEANSAEYLFRAAMLSEVSGNNKEALDLYKQLKEKFPTTPRGTQVDKYIYRLSIEPNDFSSN